MVSPGSTLYCLPPVRMIAYAIIPPFFFGNPRFYGLANTHACVNGALAGVLGVPGMEQRGRPEADIDPGGLNLGDFGRSLVDSPAI